MNRFPNNWVGSHTEMYIVSVTHVSHVACINCTHLISYVAIQKIKVGPKTRLMLAWDDGMWSRKIANEKNYNFFPGRFRLTILTTTFMCVKLI